MEVKEFVEKITLEKIEDRIKFNEISNEEFLEFKNLLILEDENNKISYITKIIEETDESDLLDGNFKTLFEDDIIKELLRKCL